MRAPEPRRVFISYRRMDVRLVEPVVRLMRAALAAGSLVFQDEDSLRAGQPWRPQIEQAIDASHLVAIFWCKHSLGSEEVRKEYERAIARRETVTPPLPDTMPVLLDSTPLPDSLGAFQGIDFREVVGSTHEYLTSARPARGYFDDLDAPLREARLEGARQRLQRREEEERYHYQAAAIADQARAMVASGLLAELLRRCGVEG